MTDIRAQGLKVFKEMLPGFPDELTSLSDDGIAGELGDMGLDRRFDAGEGADGAGDGAGGDLFARRFQPAPRALSSTTPPLRSCT